MHIELKKIINLKRLFSQKRKGNYLNKILRNEGSTLYFIFLTSLLNTLSHSSTSRDPLWSGRNCTSYWDTKMVDTYIPLVGTHRRAWCELPGAAVACRFNPTEVVLSHISGDKGFRARYQQVTLSEPTGTCPPRLTPSSCICFLFVVPLDWQSCYLFLQCVFSFSFPVRTPFILDLGSVLPPCDLT